MVLGHDRSDYSNITLDFGQYCQVYEKTRDSMTPKSMCGIEIISKNDRGSYYCMLLKTGRIINVWQ